MISIFCGGVVRFRSLAPSRASLLKGMVCAALLSMSAIDYSHAQVNGTWRATGSGVWSDSNNWLGGNIPDGGGVAVFDNFQGQNSNAAATIDTTSRTLSEIRYDQGFSIGIASSGGGGIIMGPTGLTLNAVNSTISSPATFFNTVNGIAPVISGTGSLTKTGIGNVSLSGANTFTGNVNLNQGALWLAASTAVNQDLTLGNASNSINFNGGILGVTGQTLTSSRAVNIGAGGGTIRNFSTAVFNGALTGSGQFMAQSGTSTTLAGDVSGFTGQFYADNGAFIFTGNTAMGAGSSLINGNLLTLTNTTNNVTNRLSGRNLESFGGTFVLNGNIAGTTENAGNLTLASGATTLTVSPAATGTAGTTLGFTGLTRLDRATLYARGTGLGGTLGGANIANVTFDNAPGTLIGGGGTTATNTSILPFVLGSTTGTVTSGAALSLTTWDPVSKQIIPLNTTTGYAANLATAASDDNVNVAVSEAVTSGGQTINALRFGAASTLSGGASDVLTINSGAILSTVSTSIIDAPINFGGAEGVVFASGALRINGAISGTNGLTKAGVGTLTLTGANTYTGDTTLSLGNTTVAGGTVTADGSAPSVFGQGTSPIRILSSTNTALVPNRLWTTGNLVVNRDLQVKLGGSQTPGIGTAGASTDESVVINGNVSLTAPSNNVLNRFLSLESGDNAAESVTINGVVSGNGGLRAGFGSYTILSGNNTYSGGTLIGTSSVASGAGNALQINTEVWDVRSDNALGTGTVFIHNAVNATQPVSASGIIRTGGSSAVTLNNNIATIQGFATFDGNNPLTLNGNVELNSAGSNNSVLNVNSVNAPVTINGTVSRGGLIKNGAGTLTLTGNNDYSGQTIVRQGVLSVSSIGNGGFAGNIGQGANTAEKIILSGNAAGDTGTLRYTGSGETTDRLFTLGGSGGTIDSSGSGALAFSNTGAVANSLGSINFSGLSLVIGAGVVPFSTTQAATLPVVGSAVTSTTNTFIPAGTTVTEVGQNFIRLSNNLTNTTALTAQTLAFTLPAGLNRTLTLTGSNSGLNTIAPVLANQTTVNVAVNKTGTGTWQLTGDNTYSGGTNVNDGTLFINNTTGSGTGSGNVVVAAAGTLAGAGFVAPGVANTVIIDGTVAPGNSPGTLTLGSLATVTTVDLNGLYEFELATAGTGNVAFDTGLSSPTLPHLAHDLLNVFGSLDLTGSTINVSSLASTGFDPNQSYSWLVATTNGGTLTSLPTIGVVTGTDFSAFAAQFSVGNQNGNLFLNFEAIPEPTSFTLLGLVAIGLVARRRK